MHLKEYPRLKEQLDKGTIWVDNNEYVYFDKDWGEEVNLGSVSDSEAFVEIYIRENF